MKILCVGMSVRSLVESAVGAGYQVFSLDYFGDLDTKAICRGVSLLEEGCTYPARPGDYWEVARKMNFDSFVYTAPLENHPALVLRLSKKARLYGNPPSTLRSVRDPKILQEFCRRENIGFPKTYFKKIKKSKNLLIKPKRSGGGKDIVKYDGRLPPGFVLQEEVFGIPCSVTFVSDRRRTRIIAVTRQLIGEGWLGAAGCLWCGNIVPKKIGKSHRRKLEGICGKIAEEFKLIGVNGIDFLLSGDIHILEVNPRLCGSMDAVEKSLGINLFDLHVRACEGEIEGDFVPKRCAAKAILYAERRLVTEGTERLLGKNVKDIPRKGVQISKGEPLCSVLASGKTEEECERNLKKEVDKARRFFYGA